MTAPSPPPPQPPTFDALIAASGLPRLEARLLLSHATGLKREALIARGDRPATAPAATLAQFESLAARRRAGEPIAYLVGSREFRGRDFHIDPRVLIPRPDTESLVDRALELLAPLPAPRVLDLGTGSGAIAITLALERRDASLVATDQSAPALEVAAANAARLGARVAFLRSDWWHALDASPFDLIVSNPPYIADTDPHLARGDLRHEPRDALTPGGDGTAALVTIIGGARARLRNGGWLLVEHGHDQGPAVRSTFQEAGFEAVSTCIDLPGNERTTQGRNPRGESASAAR